MIFIGVNEFLNYTSSITLLTREEEKALGQQKATGSNHARESLVHHYLPHVASAIKRAPKEIQTLNTVYALIATLETAVDGFNFLQDGETFSHHLSWRLRQCITRAIVDRY